MARMTLPEGVQFYTVAEVANYLRMSKMSVYRLLHDGDMPAKRMGRSLRIPTAEFHKWEEESWAVPSSGSAASGGEQSEGSF